MTNEEWVFSLLGTGCSTPGCLKVIAILLARFLDKWEEVKEKNGEK